MYSIIKITFYIGNKYIEQYLPPSRRTKRRRTRGWTTPLWPVPVLSRLSQREAVEVLLPVTPSNPEINPLFITYRKTMMMMRNGDLKHQKINFTQICHKFGIFFKIKCSTRNIYSWKPICISSYKHCSVLNYQIIFLSKLYNVYLYINYNYYIYFINKIELLNVLLSTIPTKGWQILPNSWAKFF